MDTVSKMLSRTSLWLHKQHIIYSLTLGTTITTQTEPQTTPNPNKTGHSPISYPPVRQTSITETSKHQNSTQNHQAPNTRQETDTRQQYGSVDRDSKRRYGSLERKQQEIPDGLVRQMSVNHTLSTGRKFGGLNFFGKQQAKR